ncbi:DUF7662 domain-containing protein [Bhargavaea massiliensis]|uniref:DUF7662 domain-containing protein n=1 Tax=Bhargavaea massiliensis TaxID=2697500 RepID=UPI001BCB4833|nr:hypothetical protein [Bhargavaea massiliensis]
MSDSMEFNRLLQGKLKEYENVVDQAKTQGLLTENTAKTYLLHANNFARWCEGEFVPGGRNDQSKRKDHPHQIQENKLTADGRGNNFDPLRKFLGFEDSNSVMMTLSQVEVVLGFKLPASAYKHAAWWSGARNHVFSWIEAGYKAKPRLEERKVEFVKII